MTSKTVHDQAQKALHDLNCVRLEPAITGLEVVLKRIDPNGADAVVIKHAMDRLDAIAWEISDIGVRLAETDFTFGRIEM